MTAQHPVLMACDGDLRLALLLADIGSVVSGDDPYADVRVLDGSSGIRPVAILTSTGAWALGVDEVLGMASIDGWQPAPIAGRDSNWMAGVVEHPDGPLFVVDVDRLGHVVLDDGEDDFTF